MTGNAQSYEVVYQGTSDDEAVGFELGCPCCEHNNTFYMKIMQFKSSKKLAGEIAKHAYNLLITKNTEGNVEYNQIIGSRFESNEYSIQQNNKCLACSAFIHGKLVDNEDMLINCLQNKSYLISIMKSFESKYTNEYQDYFEVETDYGKKNTGFKVENSESEFEDIEFEV